MNIISLNDTSNKLFYVGGAVRDELLGIKSLDVDIVYEGNAIEEIKSLPCQREGDRAAVEGFQPIQINPDFGTVRVKLLNPHLVAPLHVGEADYQNLIEIEVDFASTRQERYERKGHLPQVFDIGCSLMKDVKRRDFTVNSLYKSVSSGEILDFVGGLKDLQEKKLRILHNESFIDDPTRIIRALKFAARFGFELEENTRILRDKYLQNINYDMCYKRVKKEVIETLGLNSQKVFEEFINDEIYKLVTPLEVKLPSVNIQNLVDEYTKEDKTNVWLVYAGVLQDLSRFALTKKEQKILDDFSALENLSNLPNSRFSTDFEIYKNFEDKSLEGILLYAILKDEKIARHYLDYLRHIKILVNGKTLENMGIEPSPKYAQCFDYVLEKKLENPTMDFEEELSLARAFFTENQ